MTGKITSLSPGPRGTVSVGVSLIKAYKTGRLIISQVGEAMSVKLVSQCRKCPVLRRGTGNIHNPTLCLNILFIILFCFHPQGANYIIMGQVDEVGHGTLAPGAFTALYKPQHHKLLTNINNQPC